MADGTIRTRPWDGTTLGDAGPYSADDWQINWEAMFAGKDNVGIFRNFMSAFECVASGIIVPTVIVQSGAAVVKGIFIWLDGEFAVEPDGNGSGNARLDRIVLEIDWPSQTGTITIVKGTPALTPVLPALTQDDETLWQIPIAHIVLSSGYSSITQNDIVDDREWAATPPGTMIQLENGSGATRFTGEPVAPAASGDSRYTLGTRNNRAFLGVVQGSTPASDMGHIVRGMARLLCTTGAINIRDAMTLNTSSVWTPYDPLVDHAVAPVASAIALESVSGVNTVLADVFARSMIYARFVTDFITTIEGDNNTVLAEVPNWELTIQHRHAPMLVVAMFNGRNSGANTSSYNLRNDTDGYVLNSTNMNIVGSSSQVVTLFGIDTGLTPGSSLTYKLMALTSNGATSWAVERGRFFVMELGF